MVQFAYSIAVIFTFPLQAFPALEVVCQTTETKAGKRKISENTSILKRNIVASIIIWLLGGVAIIAIEFARISGGNTNCISLSPINSQQTSSREFKDNQDIELHCFNRWFFWGNSSFLYHNYIVGRRRRRLIAPWISQIANYRNLSTKNGMCGLYSVCFIFKITTFCNES